MLDEKSHFIKAIIIIKPKITVIMVLVILKSEFLVEDLGCNMLRSMQD